MATTFPANAQTMNALVDGLGALTLVLVSRLPREQREEVAQDLARLARGAEERGDLTLESLLMDLHRAARIGAS